MLYHNLKSRSMLALVIGLSLLCSGAYAQGDRNRTDRGTTTRRDMWGDSRPHEMQMQENKRRGFHHYYRNGQWYKRGWFGWEFPVTSLIVGSLVESLPPRYTTVIMEDGTYYYDNTTYYRQLPDGAYMVVASPPSR